MNFCSNCNNMYYIKVSDDDENNLHYYCRKCGNEVDTLISETSVVLSTHIKKKEQKFHHIINKYTKFDPTLPRINNIKCPNSSCISNQERNEENEETTEIKNEIIYIRYDDVNMKYVYVCTNCDNIWKN